MSVCVFLAEECGKIIRRVQLSGDLQATDKSGEAGPVTLADLTAQRTIEDCLLALYPTLTILGEESPESLRDIQPAV